MKPVTAAQWEEDIDYFAKKLVKKHATAFHFTTEENFNKAIADLKKDLPHLKDYQVVVRLLQITSSIGDAHTAVHRPSDFTKYPVAFFWFGKELYATRATSEYKQVLGKKLIKIDGHSLDEVGEKMGSIITSNENDWFVLNKSSAFISIPEILYAWYCFRRGESQVYFFR